MESVVGLYLLSFLAGDKEEVMFTTAKRHGWLTSTLRFIPVIAIAAAAMVALAPTDARAQGFNVFDFSCSDETFGVDVDVRGLGHTNVCVDADVTVDSDCACVGGGGNCPTDAKKQSEETALQFAQTLEPDNGRVDETVSVPITINDSLCANLDCPSGQRERLIQYEADAVFTLCTTTAAPGESCSCDPTDLTAGEILDTETCEDSAVVFPGRRNSCLDLFE
jgi:hypothetical protein